MGASLGCAPNKSINPMRFLFLPLLATLGFAAPELPDPLKQADGKVITTKEEWEKSLRSETLQLFRENIFGVTPIGRPVDFKSRVVKETPDAFEGKATIKEIEITFSTPKGERRIRPVIALPNGIE